MGGGNGKGGGRKGKDKSMGKGNGAYGFPVAQTDLFICFNGFV